ncbi:uncharacterized protein DDB_G0283697-like [Bacillus rossius redtenbacheri]|uniref:uncharacterized protein DDB_G0283697-like n=1 Tax=Bacillus rossius redtenbacheri TaxID=93214 RepID=UPI002FDCDC33
MELYEVVNTQYAFPVGVVLICAVLVFTFGFKSVEQPVFPHLSHTADDRKQTAGKKRKVKDKKPQQNGPLPTPSDDSSPEVKQKESVSKQSSKQDKDKSPTKEAPRREKKQETVLSESPVKDKNAVVRSRGKENQAEEAKNRKNEKNLAKLLKQEEKPLDFDEGQWEQALSRKDKKSRKKDELIEVSTPTKKESPSKKKKSAKNLVLAATDNKLQEDLEGKADKQSEKEQEVGVKKAVLIESMQAMNRENSASEKHAEEESADAAVKAKKKNNKKKPAKNDNNSNKVGSEPTPAPSESRRLAPKKQPQAVIELDLEPPEPIGAVVFDELGDVWKEARVPKKSKKKVRREQ